MACRMKPGFVDRPNLTDFHGNASLPPLKGCRQTADTCYMWLSVEMLGDILESLRSYNRDSRGTEKRTQPRVGLRAEAEVIPPHGANGQLAVVRLRDVSAGGMNILYPRAVDTGSQLTMVLRRKRGGVIGIPCTVRHCRPVSRDLYSVGVQFRGRISKSILASTTSHRHHTPGATPRDDHSDEQTHDDVPTTSS